MNKLFFFFFIITSSVSVMAQNDEQQVSAAVETLRKAMVDADQKQLENIAAEQLSYGHSGGKIENKADFVQNIVNGHSDFVTIALSEQTISLSGDVAVVRHKFLAETNDKGTQGNVHLAVLLVWQKFNGQWKLLARQAVKLK